MVLIGYTSGHWALLPRGWKAELEVSHIPPHLDLVLLPSILHGLEDAPGALPPHLQACHVAPVPSLDQGRCLEGCDMDGEASLRAGVPWAWEERRGRSSTVMWGQDHAEGTDRKKLK